MATIDYDSLSEDYKDFAYPFAQLFVKGKNLADSKVGFGISEIDVDLTSDYEASIATVRINKVFDMDRSKFLTDSIKDYSQLGSQVKIALGYQGKTIEVFRGFIARVNFVYEKDDMPAVVLTCMDVKGMMMANNYSKQLTANCWSAAVKEIFEQPYYTGITDPDNGIIKDLKDIYDTPDAQEAQAGGGTEATDKTIELVAESDYEFVVKAAKKFNYEFFVQAGQLVFRSAKSDSNIFMEITPKTGLLELDVEYDITGLVESVEVRNVNAGKGKLVQSKSKISNTVSPIVSNTLYKGMSKIYIDPTAATDNDAGYRAKYLVEDISYRFGTFKAILIGIPDLIPGVFVNLKGLGGNVNNKFYITNVRHHLVPDGEYRTVLTGKAATLTTIMDI